MLIVSSLLSITVTTPAIAQELLKTLTVTGNGIEKIPSTIAQVELGVEIQGKTAREVQQEIAQRAAAIVDLLRKQDVEQLQTTGVRLNPTYDRVDPRNNQRIISGYIGTNTVSFQVGTEEVGELLDLTVQAGATRVSGVSFTASPEAVGAAKKSALRRAAINAQDKANVVLESLNLTAKEVVTIEVDAAKIRQPKSVAREQFSLADSASVTPVIPGEQTVQAEVTLQISY